MRDTARLLLMLRVARRDPREFLDRARGILDRSRDRFRARMAIASDLDPLGAFALLDKKLSASTSEWAKEAALAEIERAVSVKITQWRNRAPIPQYENADFSLARFCYVACRALKPRAVLETGVASGVTSAFILRALSMNGAGELWSIDLPPLVEDARRHVGYVIPEELKSRWRLRVGPSRRMLAPLLSELRQVDLFIHDSLHTYHNMRREFQTVWSFLKPGGLLIADDVELNCALADFARSRGCCSWCVVSQETKTAYFGAVVKEA